MQCALDLRLPWQRMDQLVQPHCRFEGREGLALVVEQLEVGHQAERIGHGDHPGHQPDPVPRHAGRVVLALVSPQGLACARAAFIAEVQNAGPEMRELKLRRPPGLPQYGWPGTDNPSWSDGGSQVDGELLIEQSVAPVWQRPAGLQSVRVVR